MASLPSNVSWPAVPAIGFISHLDTSPDFSGKTCKTSSASEDYRGGDIAARYW